MNKLKYLVLAVVLVGCQSFKFAGGAATVVDNGATGSGSPYFTLECQEINGCYKYAALWCPEHRYHVVGKKNTNDKKWQVEFACESGLND